MKHIRAVLIVALVAGAFAVVPPGASATAQFEGPTEWEYPLTVSGQGSGGMVFNGGGAAFECAPTTFAATLVSPNTNLTSTSVANSKCTYSGEFKMNGCQLTLHPNTQTIDLGTTGCGPITFGGSPCNTISILPKTGVAATYTNAGGELDGTVTVQIYATGLSYDFGAVWCNDGNDGTLVAKFVLSAKNEWGESRGIRAIYPGVPVGIHANSEGFRTTNHSYYPATVSGSNSTTYTFDLPGMVNVTCKSTTFTGSIVEATNALGLAPTYENGEKCEASMGKSTVKANSCKVILSYGKNSAIACSKEGDAIEIVGPMTCTIKFPAQTAGGSPLTYEQLGGTVRAKGSLSALKYTSTKACQFIGVPASGENGIMPLDTTLKAVFGV